MVGRGGRGRGCNLFKRQTNKLACNGNSIFIFISFIL
jgi:hypothetical protein